MRLFHFSDTHLGHQQYPRTDATGLNQREVDIAAAFLAVIDRAVAEKPDLVIHAGDLFDGVRPGNRALATAMEGFLKLSQAGIPVVCIAGNHEHPKMRETGSPFRLFEHLSGIHMVFRGAAETLTVATPSGTARIHAVPQCADADTLAAQVASIQTATSGFDVLVLHGAVPSLPAFAHAEFNELTLDPAWFGRFHYVALGHYHGRKQVAPNAWYCGAPERVSIAEAGEPKGFLDVQLRPTGAAATFHDLPGRIYADLPTLDAKGMTAAAIKDEAIRRIRAQPAGAVVRLRIQGIDATLRGGLELAAIRAAGGHLVHLELKPEWAEQGLDAAAATELGGLTQAFDEFAATQPMEAGLRESVVPLARKLLEAP